MKKRIILVLVTLLLCSGLCAELIYDRGGDYNYLRLSYSYTDTTDKYLIWAQESRILFSGNYNHYEITTTDEQKAYDLLLLLSESDSYAECIKEYAENNKNLILQKKETKLSENENLIVYFYYTLK